MSEPPVTPPPAEGDSRLAAHERLSTGALASWARMCATHPWRVVFAWIGIIATLIVLVSTIGGSLRDKFEIPGSDTQRATDLLKAEFASEQGAVMNIVLAAPEGERLDTPERKAAIDKVMAELRVPPFGATKGAEPVDGEPKLTSVADPFAENTFSKNGRIAYSEAQFDQTIEDKDRDGVVAVQDKVREAVEPVGVTAEFNGEAEFPPIEQGTSELLGLLAAVIVLLIVFRTFVAMLIPILVAIVALMTAFLLLFILAGQTDINTVTPLLVSMIGLGVGIDYSLFIVTRFRQLLHDGLSPADAAAEAGASAGRAVLFAGLTVAISVAGLAFIGLDFVTKLGIGSSLGVLTTVLIANSLLLAVLRLLGHKVDRLKVPFIKPVDESEEARERTLVARWGRFVTRRASIIFPVLLVIGVVLAGTSGLVRLGAADQGTQPKKQTSRKAYDLLAEGFGPGFNGPVPIVVDVNSDKGAAPADRRRSEGRRQRRLRRKPAVQRRRDGGTDLRHPHVGSAGRGDRQARRPPTQRRRAGGDGGWRRARVRLRSDRSVQGHRRQDHQPDAGVPAVHHRRDVPRARDGVPLDRRLCDRGGDDAALGVHRVRRARPRRPAGKAARAHRSRQDGADRDVRPADRVRDPVRPLDGLHGLPDEPHPRGARARARDPRGGRSMASRRSAGSSSPPH